MTVPLEFRRAVEEVIRGFLEHAVAFASNISVAGASLVTGTAAGFRFYNRDDQTKYFEWYANASLARLYSSQQPGDTLTIDNLGNTTFSGNAIAFGTVPFFAGVGVPGALAAVNGSFYFNATGGVLTTIYQRRAGAWVGIV